MKKLLSYLLTGAMAVGMASCSDWTEPEAVDQNYGTVEDSENYPAYLESLRNYRNTQHTQIYAWVELGEDAPANQSQRVTSFPDSIDVLVLSAVNQLHPIVAKDLAKVRNDKGMKVIMEIDFDGLKKNYAELCAMNAVERDAIVTEYAQRDDFEDPNVQAEMEAKLAEFADPTLNDYVLSQLTSKLNYVKQMNLDGALFAFDGKGTNTLTPAELAEYNAQKLLFLGAAADWRSRNPGFIFDYMGKPQNIKDTNIINDFGNLFVRQGLSASSVSQFTLYLNMAQAEGVPTQKLGMMTTFISSDENDVTTGVFADGTYAIDGMINWVRTAPVSAVGIQNVQFDYFSSLFSYPHVRALIKAANPN